MLVIWASDIWIKHWLFHAQISHNLGPLSIGIPFTHSIQELSYICPHGADGSVNTFREGVCLVRCALHEVPNILQTLSQWGVSGCRYQPFCFIIGTNDTVHPCVPESQKSCSQGFPLLTQVDQLCLSILWISCELSHAGGPLRMPPPGLRLLLLPFLLYNGPRCQAGTQSHNIHHPFSHNIHHHRCLLPCRQRCWLFKATEFLL